MASEDDDAYEDTAADEDDRDEDYVANDGDDGGDGDDDDEDDASEDAAPRRRAAPAPRTRRSTRSTKSYKDDSDDEVGLDDEEDEEEPDDDDDEDDEEEEDDEADDDGEEDYAPRARRSGAAAAAARPRRQAAQEAKARLKHRDTPEDDDEEIARAIDREINGLRARPRKAAPAAPEERAVSPRGRRGGSISRQSSVPPPAAGRAAAGGSAAGGRRRAPPCRTSQRTVAKVSYAESDDSDDEDGGGGGGRGGGGGKAREALSAFEDPDEDEVEDEIDKVLGHRESETLSPVPGDPWASREFYIKWKRYSYIHCSWDSRAALEHLRGFKRVLLYIKKVDDVEAGWRFFSREEQEMQDVEREMEAQLNQQHMQVERVLAEKEASVPSPAEDPGEDEGRGSVGPPGQRRRELEAADAEMVTVTKYLVKWEGLPYAECTWETLEDVNKAGGGPQIDLYLQREQRLLEPGRSVDVTRKQFKIKGTRALEKQPEYLQGGELRDYQLESLNWMIYSWSENRNIILADEMGLGKTVQCVSFVGYLAETLQMRGPFLVVVPLSTVPNWIREFRRWVPFVNAVVYVGDSRSREVLRAYECDPAPHHRASRPHKFEVLLTTYELILKDAPILSRIKWAYLLVDEAHRLKNAESALYQELMEWHFKNKLLVTGTPLQNNLKELWALLHFLEPDKFPTCERFEAEYSLETAETVSGLHGVLRPHLLRRVIKDVEKSLPPKNERILRVDMTPLQKQYYKWILTRNFKELNKSSRGGGHVSLLNIIGELKKCCNHPFLFESAEEDYRGSETDKSAVDRLIVTSGKMVLLDKLLRRLKQTGHRVLVFSQMVRVLDIISDYMRLRGYPHQRLDGSTPAASRHAAMEHFNRPDSPDFAFLLSTRAGGLGINLATADTVIIFDSDWNPQNDLQAMSRAHRIGQTETVNIYRFVTSGSVEEDILERAKRKMVLDHLVIQRMDTSGRTILDPAAGKATASAKQMFGKDELAAILRFGAEDLFKQQLEDDGNAAERARNALYEDDIDAILERAEVVDTRALAAAGAEENAAAAAELLSSFNVATFKNEEDDVAFWNKLIPASERPKEEEEDLLPRAARRMLDPGGADSDDDNGGGAGGSGGAGAAGHRRGGGRGGRGGRAGGAGGGRRGPGASAGAEPGPPVDGAALRVDEWIVEVDDEGLPVTKDDGTEPESRSLSRRDAAAFVRAVRRYGRHERLADVASEVGRSLEDASPGQRLSLWYALMDGCKAAVQKTTEEQAEDAKDAILDFFGVSVKAAELLAVCSHLRLLAKKVAAARDPAVQNFRLDATSQLSVPKWGKAINWTSREDALLLLGVHLHGMGHWDQVAADEALRPLLADKLAGAVGGAAAREEAAAGKDGLPKASHLETRALGLLRKMHATHKAATAPPVKRQGAAGRKKQTQLPLSQQPAAAAPASQHHPPHDRDRDARAEGAVTAAAIAPARADRDREREREPPATGTVAAAREGAAQAAMTNGGAGAAGPSGPGGSKRKNGAGAAHDAAGPAEKRARVEKAEAKADGKAVAADGPAGRDDVKALLEPAMSDIRKLRKLQDGSITDKNVIVQNTKLYLAAIGRHIEQVTAAKGGKVGKKLWDLAARNIGNGKTGEELHQLHQRIKQSQQGPVKPPPQAQPKPKPQAQSQPRPKPQPHAKAPAKEPQQPPQPQGRPRMQSPRPQPPREGPTSGAASPVAQRPAAAAAAGAAGPSGGLHPHHHHQHQQQAQGPNPQSPKPRTLSPPAVAPHPAASHPPAAATTTGAPQQPHQAHHRAPQRYPAGPTGPPPPQLQQQPPGLVQRHPSEPPPPPGMPPGLAPMSRQQSAPMPLPMQPAVSYPVMMPVAHPVPPPAPPPFPPSVPPPMPPPYPPPAGLFQQQPQQFFHPHLQPAAHIPPPAPPPFPPPMPPSVPPPMPPSVPHPDDLPGPGPGSSGLLATDLLDWQQHQQHMQLQMQHPGRASTSPTAHWPSQHSPNMPPQGASLASVGAAAATGPPPPGDNGSERSSRREGSQQQPPPPPPPQPGQPPWPPEAPPQGQPQPHPAQQAAQPPLPPAHFPDEAPAGPLQRAGGSRELPLQGQQSNPEAEARGGGDRRDRDPRDGRDGRVDRQGPGPAYDESRERDRGGRERLEWRERRSSRSRSRDREREYRSRDVDRERDTRDRRDTRDPRDTREPRDRDRDREYDPRDRERRDPRDSRDPRDTRDPRDRDTRDRDHDRERERERDCDREREQRERDQRERDARDRDRDRERERDRDRDREHDRDRDRGDRARPRAAYQDDRREQDRGRDWPREHRDYDRERDRDRRDRSRSRDRSRDRRHRSRSRSRDRRDPRDREYDRRRDWDSRDRRGGARSRSGSRDRRGERDDRADERGGRGSGGGSGGGQGGGGGSAGAGRHGSAAGAWGSGSAAAGLQLEGARGSAALPAQAEG